MDSSTALFALPMEALAVVATYFAAKRRRRRTVWAALAFWFPALLLVLVCLPAVGGKPQGPRFAASLETVAVAVLLLVFGLWGWSYLETRSLDGLPACGSPIARDTALRSYNSSPEAIRRGSIIIGLDGDHELSRSSQMRNCTAVATMKDQTNHQADYRIERRGGQIFVGFQRFR